MKEIILKVPDHKVDFIKELIEQLGLDLYEKPEISEEQREEIKKRLELVDSGEMSTRDWKKAKKEIFKR